MRCASILVVLCSILLSLPVVAGHRPDQQPESIAKMMKIDIGKDLEEMGGQGVRIFRLYLGPPKGSLELRPLGGALLLYR